MRPDNSNGLWRYRQNVRARTHAEPNQNTRQTGDEGRGRLQEEKTSEQRAEHELETRSQIWLSFFSALTVAVKQTYQDRAVSR